MADDLPHVLNVIAEDAGLLAKELRDIGAKTLGPLHWLSDGHAFDIAFAGEPEQVRKAALKVAGSRPADINIVSATRRRKRLLVADMDSTIIGCECLDELADMAGLKSAVAAITEQAMRGEIAFEGALRARVALLKGLPLAVIARVIADRVRLNPGATTLVATMRAHGAHALLVSGGFSAFTQAVAAMAGFDAAQANVLLDNGTHLLGTVREPILGREAKDTALCEAAARHGIELADTLAVGDGANDLAMIARAGLGVAWHAKPIVAAAADAAIAHADLTALLYLQGYSDAEIVRR
ncbi:MAG TPA: phosphoserine phosphatase SerB [Rhizomicrobium sp.]